MIDHFSDDNHHQNEPGSVLCSFLFQLISTYYSPYQGKISTQTHTLTSENITKTMSFQSKTSVCCTSKFDSSSHARLEKFENTCKNYNFSYPIPYKILVFFLVK